MLSAVENHLGPSRAYTHHHHPLPPHHHHSPHHSPHNFHHHNPHNHLAHHNPYIGNSGGSGGGPTSVTALLPNYSISSLPPPLNTTVAAAAAAATMSAAEFARPHPKPRYNGSSLTNRNGLSSPRSSNNNNNNNSNNNNNNKYAEQCGPVNLAVGSSSASASKSPPTSNNLSPKEEISSLSSSRLILETSLQSMHSDETIMSSSVNSLYVPSSPQHHKLLYGTAPSISVAGGQGVNSVGSSSNNGTMSNVTTYQPLNYSTLYGVYGKSIYSTHHLSARNHHLHSPSTFIPSNPLELSYSYLPNVTTYNSPNSNVVMSSTLSLPPPPPPPPPSSPQSQSSAPVSSSHNLSTTVPSTSLSISGIVSSSSSLSPIASSSSLSSIAMLQNDTINKVTNLSLNNTNERIQQQNHQSSILFRDTKQKDGKFYNNINGNDNNNGNSKNVGFKVPSGKEGSLKHRILTRPYSEKDSKRKSPIKSASVINLPPTNTIRSNFSKGVLIELANGEVRRVEDMRTEDFITSSAKTPGLELADSTVIKITQGPTNVVVTLSCDKHKTKVNLPVYPEHPFFVYSQGWASCDPEGTLALHGLKCQRLQVGDVCISLRQKDPDLNFEQQSLTTAVISSTSSSSSSLSSSSSSTSSLSSPLATTISPQQQFRNDVPQNLSRKFTRDGSSDRIAMAIQFEGNTYHPSLVNNSYLANYMNDNRLSASSTIATSSIPIDRTNRFNRQTSPGLQQPPPPPLPPPLLLPPVSTSSSLSSMSAINHSIQNLVMNTNDNNNHQQRFITTTTTATTTPPTSHHHTLNYHLNQHHNSMQPKRIIQEYNSSNDVISSSSSSQLSIVPTEALIIKQQQQHLNNKDKNNIDDNNLRHHHYEMMMSKKRRWSAPDNFDDEQQQQQQQPPNKLASH